MLFFFVVVTVGGFLAVRWRRTAALDSLDEWGLGGRSFGTVVTWFLLGGDLYTAYTFVAVPAAMFATGAVSGFFAVPYTIVAYPIVFVFLPRLWSVAHRHGYVTPADFVRGRYDSRVLALAVAVTGILATMPYIALQLVGIQAVLDTMGLGGSGNAFVRDLPLIIAFAVLAAYTYSSGLRAPALIAFVKDTLIYIVIVVAVVYIATKIGFGTMFESAKTQLTTPDKKTGIPPGQFVANHATYWAYGTLAFGSALALFMYPHSMTAVLSGRRRNTIRRNTAILPAYSLMLALLALLGYAAIYEVKKKGMTVYGQDGVKNPQLAVPHFFQTVFPSWFAGVAFAAIAIGALVPAAIMSIAASNLFTRNIYREFLRPSASPREEARVSKIVSLVVKFGALLFVLGTEQAGRHQLPAAGRRVDPADDRRDRRRASTRAGCTGGRCSSAGPSGMVYGTVVAYRQTVPDATTKLVHGAPVTTVSGVRHFGASLADFPFTSTKVYIAATALVLNVLVTVVLTLVLRAVRAPAGGRRDGADGLLLRRGVARRARRRAAHARRRRLTGHRPRPRAPRLAGVFHLVFVTPRIPPNTGNAIRTAAATGTHLHLVEPLGFSLDDAQLRRAGLDYHDLAVLTVHPSFDALLEAVPPASVYAFTASRHDPLHRHRLPAGRRAGVRSRARRPARRRARPPGRHAAAAHPHAARTPVAEPRQHRRHRGVRGLAPARLRHRRVSAAVSGSAAAAPRR